ncbi:DUF5994 family protein [Streptomyces sp. NPDC048491]|uniref:DUF5994 family protein n=1 Tax=Streptomyces sp. NPDC048491 TaxID=3157207 RepID=UPI00343BA21A
MTMTLDRLTTTGPLSATCAGTSPPQARLALTPAGRVPGPLDGAWWPHTRDLSLELPPLAAALDERWGRITHAAVNPALWAAIPDKVLLPGLGGRVMRVGWSTEQDPQELLLRSYTIGCWHLLVIPPETGPPTASQLMASASHPQNPFTASALMTAPRSDRR